MNKRLCVTIAAVIASGLMIFGLAVYKADISEKATELKQDLMTKPSPTNSYRIVVDEETLIQYIIFEKNTGYADARTGGITVRVRPDGTPYTIDPEDLDKYEHFSLDNNVK